MDLPVGSSNPLRSKVGSYITNLTSKRRHEWAHPEDVVFLGAGRPVSLGRSGRAKPRERMVRDPILYGVHLYCIGCILRTYVRHVTELDTYGVSVDIKKKKS